MEAMLQKEAHKARSNSRAAQISHRPFQNLPEKAAAQRGQLVVSQALPPAAHACPLLVPLLCSVVQPCVQVKKSTEMCGCEGSKLGQVHLECISCNTLVVTNVWSQEEMCFQCFLIEMQKAALSKEKKHIFRHRNFYRPLLNNSSISVFKGFIYYSTPQCVAYITKPLTPQALTKCTGKEAFFFLLCVSPVVDLKESI